MSAVHSLGNAELESSPHSLKGHPNALGDSAHHLHRQPPPTPASQEPGEAVPGQAGRPLSGRHGKAALPEQRTHVRLGVIAPHDAPPPYLPNRESLHSSTARASRYAASWPCCPRVAL